MRKLILALLGLMLLAALAEGIILAQTGLDPWRLASVLVSLSLLLGAFVALAATSATRRLRHWAQESASAAAGMPFLLLVPYLVFALGTGTFSLRGFAKVCAYIAVPTALLLPDRLHKAEKLGWRDLAAMLALAVPVSGHWLEGIWAWPEEIYFFRPLVCVCVGAYDFMIVRNLEGIGYRLGLRREDVITGLSNFAAFAILAIPLGLSLNFLHPHPTLLPPTEFSFRLPGHTLTTQLPDWVNAPWLFAFRLFGIYITIALPEELLFRGILQNFLVRTLSHRRRELFGLLIASVVFGAAHLHHPPVPNWRYAIVATLAGMFYGNVYRTRQRLSASSLTHAVVDTVWHFWF